MKLTLEQERTEAPANPMMIVFEAIVRQRCIGATYNRKRMILAPHIVYTRHDALYVDAIIVSREAMVPREIRLGTFKIDGLSEIRLTERPFEINALFEAEAEKYVGFTLMKVELEPVEG